MFERYTERARRVLFFARYEASQLGSLTIGTEHVLLGLVREGKGLSRRLFDRAGLSAEAIRREIEGRTTFREKVPTSVEIPFSADTKRVLHFAAEESDRLRHRHIGTEHLLLGILREEPCVAAEVLRQAGLRLERVREDIVQLTSGGGAAATDDARTARAGDAGHVPHFIRSSVVHIMRSARPAPSMVTTDRTWMALGFGLRRLVAAAWTTDERRVELPPALEEGAYDVVLMLPHAAEREVMHEIVGAAIEEQFGVSVTHETRDVEVSVVTAPTGPGPALRANPTAPGVGAAGLSVLPSNAVESAPSRIPDAPVHEFSVSGAPMALLCLALEDVLGEPVVDETRLPGTFDLALTGVARNREAFVAALRQQAGLEITRAQRTVEMVVVRPLADALDL